MSERLKKKRNNFKLLGKDPPIKSQIHPQLWLTLPTMKDAAGLQDKQHKLIDWGRALKAT